MSSFRRLALLLALGLPAMNTLQAQSSSSNPATPAPDQAQPAAQSPQTMSVQARIKARREKRRAQAIHDVYGHLYEAYVGAGYLRFTPGSTLQRVNEYNWNVGFTRYYSERMGITVDGRGYYGTPFIEPKPNNQNVTKPTISEYAAMIGPTYRFYEQPKFSISGRVLGGYAYGNFSGDIGGNTALATYLGLYPNSSTYAASAAVIAEYNISPHVGLRVAPEYFLSGFGSTTQNNLGYTGGLVVRFGKQ
jgi:hypothetical protein